MNSKRKPAPDDPEQSARFEQTAKELEVDESGKSFQRALTKVVPVKKRAAKRKVAK